MIFRGVLPFYVLGIIPIHELGNPIANQYQGISYMVLKLLT